MFCSKCGENLAEGTMYCPKCGTNVGANNNSAHSNPMPVQQIVMPDQQTVIGGWVALVLGVIGIIFPLITMINESNKWGKYYDYPKGLIALTIISFIVAIVGIILINGRHSSLHDTAYRSMDLGSIAPLSQTTGEAWVCKKCSERNPIASSSCKGCGAYK